MEIDRHRLKCRTCRRRKSEGKQSLIYTTSDEAGIRAVLLIAY